MSIISVVSLFTRLAAHGGQTKELKASPPGIVSYA